MVFGDWTVMVMTFLALVWHALIVVERAINDDMGNADRDRKLDDARGR
jgi:hypothetical protein